MSMPLVSIIIPCWNGEEIVGEAIESALAQNYPNAEVIVVDDGSTDRSLEVIRAFGSRVKVTTGPNLGGGAARNIGIRMAKGDFVQFLDADDLLHPDKLSNQTAASLDVAEDVVVFCDGYCDMDPRRYVREDDCSDPLRFVLARPLQTPSPLHRRQWLARVGGWREDLPCAQERDLHVRLVCAGMRLARLPEILFTVRRRKGSVSSDTTRVYQQHLEIARSALKLLADREVLCDEHKQPVAGFLARAGRALFRSGAAAAGEECFRAARAVHHGGGLDDAYGNVMRRLCTFLGAERVERLVALGRWSKRNG